MCGIIAVFSQNPTNLHGIMKAFNLMESRGPDCGHFLTRDNGIIGFRRLCINDVSSNGNQPMESKSGVILVCNGEIYNHKELATEFDIKCESTSDCEVILRLYEKIGFEETINRLDGVFALVIMDGDKCLIARDRIGVRPLYGGWTENGEYAVASLAKSLACFCHDIEQIPPGMVIYDQVLHTRATIRHSFNISTIKNPHNLLRHTLINAVKKRLMSDRPIGCLLSGGLDSSLVTSILCNLLGPKNVRTYSIGMIGSTDLAYARSVADYLGTVHTEVTFTPEEGIAIIPEVIYSLESYDITTIRASVGMYLLSKYISENTDDRVIFSGEGSDELLAGYLYFHYAPSPVQLENECFRLVNDLYMYDALRADKTVSVHGLELRVPFLDKDFVDLALSLSGKQRMPTNGYEKHILRNDFKDCYIPDEVLWRRKEGFSDGVSSVKKSWSEYIKEYVSTFITDDEFTNSSFISKEAMWYKKVFNSHFPTYQPDIYMWMPKWVHTNDPSGRVMEVYDQS